jgi:hypothetical protein
VPYGRHEVVPLEAWHPGGLLSHVAAFGFVMRLLVGSSAPEVQERPRPADPAYGMLSQFLTTKLASRRHDKLSMEALQKELTPGPASRLKAHDPQSFGAARRAAPPGDGSFL